MKKLLTLTSLLVVLSYIAGCTTALYGKTFEETQATDEYTIKVYTGGLAFRDVATERVKEESEKFMAQKGYRSYKIISSRYELAPSGVVFIVQFNK